MSMKNYFYTSEHATILFKDWHTMTWAELLGSCIAVAVLGALYEGLKVGRDLLDEHMRKRWSSTYPQEVENRCECAHRDDHSQTTTATSSSVVFADGKKSNNRRSWRHHRICHPGHFVQTLLYFVQLWISLCLMLVFMTFNVYLCLAVTVGGAVGYYCFGWAHTRRPGHETAICH